MTDDSRRTWAAPGNLIETLKHARGLSRARRIARGRDLYSQGEVSTRFFLIVSGLLKVSIFREDGTEVILEFMGAGTVCGEGAALDGLPRFSSASALEDTEVLEFDVADWPAAGTEATSVMMALLQVTALKQRVLALRLEQLFSREPEGRILDLFERLASVGTGGQAGEGPGTVLPHLTHEHIAAMTGMTRVTVTRALARLRQQGNIVLEGGRFRLATGVA